MVVDLVVDGDGDDRNDPGKELERQPLLAFLKVPEGADDVEHRSVFHGGAASDRAVPGGVGL